MNDDKIIMKNEDYVKLIDREQFFYRASLGQLGNCNIRYERAYIRSHIPRNVTNILDIGSNDGWNSYQIYKERKCRVTGVELCKGLYEIAKNKYTKKGKLEFINVDAQELPFDDNLFDCVHSRRVLEHVRDVESTLKEWHRVLKDGGTFICCVPFMPTEELRKKAVKDDKSQLHFFDELSFLKKIRDAGFKPKKIELIDEIYPNIEILCVAVKSVSELADANAALIPHSLRDNLVDKMLSLMPITMKNRILKYLYGMESINFPFDDPIWRNLLDFIDINMNPKDIIVAPSEFLEFIKIQIDIILYEDIILKNGVFTVKNIDKIIEPDWFIIHKGRIRQMDTDLLKLLMSNYKPVFVNEVFVVFVEPEKELNIINKDSDHYKALVKKSESTI